MPSTREIRFQDHGENLALGEDDLSVTWKPVYSGGFAFTNLPMNQGDKITIELGGYGEIRFGALQIEPIFFPNLRKFAYSDDVVKTISQYKLFSSSLELVTIVRGRKQDGDVLTLHSVTGRRKYYCNVIRNKNVWIVFELMYGDIYAEIIKTGVYKNFKFHQNRDINVKAVSECDTTDDVIERLFFSPTKITLFNTNPWTSCTVNRFLKCGEILTMNCEPISKGRRKPEIFSLKIFISDSQQEIFTRKLTENYKYYMTKELTNEECEGHIQLSISNSGHVVLINNKGHWSSVHVRKKDVFLIMSLYRVKVQIVRIVQQ